MTAKALLLIILRRTLWRRIGLKIRRFWDELHKKDCLGILYELIKRVSLGSNSSLTCSIIRIYLMFPTRSDRRRIWLLWWNKNDSFYFIKAKKRWLSILSIVKRTIHGFQEQYLFQFIKFQLSYPAFSPYKKRYALK